MEIQNSCIQRGNKNLQNTVQSIVKKETNGMNELSATDLN